MQVPSIHRLNPIITLAFLFPLFGSQMSKDQISNNACVNIPEMGEEFRTLHMCYPGDVVLTKGGRVQNSRFNYIQPSYVTRDLIFINASALSRKDYIVLYLFFPAGFAYKQMVRSSSMTAQPHLTITLIRDLLVCNYSNSFKDKVEKYFTTLEKLNHQAVKSCILRQNRS